MRQIIQRRERKMKVLNEKDDKKADYFEINRSAHLVLFTGVL